MAAANELKMGDLADPATVIGPIIDRRSRERIQALIDDALENGADLLCGNRWTGNRLSPTVLGSLSSQMRISREEVFGPVVCLERVDGVDQAILSANAAPAILSASVFTREIDAALSCADRLRTAMVHINDMTIQQEPEVPFGGDGASGFGREGMETALEDFTRWQWITIKRGDSAER